MNDATVQQLATDVRRGDRRALARALTLIERGGAPVRSLRQALAGHGVGSLVGITGAPGAGKSSLTTVIAQELRQRGMQVGIIAVDPSSPLSGGSLLGDRIRMYDLAGDSGVFIRSMANRGQYGGLAATTLDAAMLMRAAGFGMVLLETVGAGQSDVAVVDVADTVLLVEAPGMGDEVQSIKAGLLEVADVIVVSKSDRTDAPATLQQLRALIRMQMDADDVWSVPVLPVSALRQTGVADLVNALLAHAQWLQTHPATWRQQRRQLLSLQRALEAQLRDAVQQLPGWTTALTQLGQRDSDALARQLLEEFVVSGFTKE